MGVLLLKDALCIVVHSDCFVVVDTAAVCVGVSVVVADDTLKLPADTAGTVGTAVVDDTAAGTAVDTVASRIAAGTVGTVAADSGGTAAEFADNAAEETVAGIVCGTEADDTARSAARVYRSSAPAALGSKDLVA